jgi:DNA repair protein RadD
MKLRDFQPKVERETIQALKQYRNVLVAAPTGSGKSVMAASLAHKLLLACKRGVFVVHMDGLAVQFGSTFSRYLEAWGHDPDKEIGWITGGRKPDYSKPLQIASIQALTARRSTIEDMVFHVVLWDEAHLSSAHKFAQDYFLQGAFKGKNVGYTATPVRTNPRESMLSLGWQVLVAAPPPLELMAKGLLVPRMEYWSLPSARIDTSGVKTRLGDFDQKELGAISSTPEQWKHAWDEWNRLAQGKRTLGFAVTVKHGEDLRDFFRDRQVNAEVVSAKTPREERQRLYTELAAGRLKVLFGVGVTSIGFDRPEVECLLCCRPTKSEQVWIQILGRGARRCEGKTHCTVIDLAGNCAALGLLEEQGDWKLEPPLKKEKGDAPIRFCPECGAQVPAQSRTCENCGYEFPAKEKKEKAIDVSQLEQIEVPKRFSRQQRDFVNYCKKARKMNWRPGWADANYKERHGRYPETGWRLHAVYGANPGTRELADYAGHLGLLCRKHGESWDWALRYLISEFGLELIDQHREGLVRCWRKGAGISETKAA